VKRIFYISGFKLTAFHWQGKDFVGSYAFDQTEDGLGLFTKYLESIKSGSLKILVDVIEEDFIKEKIPHVGKNDQRAIVSRYINRLYRKSSDFYTYKIIGRETKGRKDDIALYSVITNPEVFSKWLDSIQSKQIPLSGIWSLPLISESIVKQIANESGNVLLVSQQVPNNLRQSFFINGKFEISRNAVINPDELSLGEYINEEVEQTSRFLANQRFIGFDEIVNIHVICSSRDIENIKTECEDTPLKVYHYHAINDIKDTIGCNEVPGDLASGLFSFLCKSKSIISGHYGPKELFRYFYRKLLNSSIHAINFTVIIISILIVINYFINSQVLEAETVVLNQQKDRIKNKYNRDYKQNESELSQAVAIQSSVLFYDRVDALKNISPQNFMNKFSLFLQKSGVQNITITQVSWSSNQGNVTKTKNIKSNAYLEFSSNKEIKHFAKIKGLIGSKADDFGNAVRKVNAILATLDRHQSIERLDIIKMPFDVRPESDLNNSYRFDGNAKESKHRDFEFHVVVKGDGNV